MAILSLTKSCSVKLADLQIPPDQYAVVLFSSNPWGSLEIVGVPKRDVDDLKARCQYKDRWSSNVYYTFVPVALLISTKQTVLINSLGANRDPAVLHELRIRKSPSPMEQAYLGHGYDDVCLFGEGTPSWVLNAASLVQGGYLVGWLRKWTSST